MNEILLFLPKISIGKKIENYLSINILIMIQQ